MKNVSGSSRMFEKSRSGGFWRFVLCKGALGWGIAAAIFFLLVQVAASNFDVWRDLPIALVMFFVGGPAWGAIMWSLFKIMYRNNRRPNSP